jgi:hypothetical protein
MHGIFSLKLVTRSSIASSWFRRVNNMQMYAASVPDKDAAGLGLMSAVLAKRNQALDDFKFHQD